MKRRETPTKIAAVIDARTRSAALPGAPLIPLGGRPALCHVIARLEAVAGVDAIAVVTDDPAMEAVLRETCDAFVTPGLPLTIEVGEMQEVAARLAEDHEVVIWAEGHAPLISSGWIEEALRAAMERPDGVALPDSRRTGLADGAGVRIYRRAALVKAEGTPSPLPVFPPASERLRSDWRLSLREPEDLGSLSLVFDLHDEAQGPLQAEEAIDCLNRLAVRAPEVAASARKIG